MKKPESALTFHEIIKLENFFPLQEKSITNAKLKEVVARIQKDYLPWEKIKYLKTPTGFSNNDLWAISKFRRATSSQAIAFASSIFKYSITPTIQKALHEFDMHYGGSLVMDHPLMQQDRQQYLMSSIMEEAIASSQVEGAITTRIVAKEMLRQNQKPRNTSEIMIVNNYRTIQYIRETINENLTPEKFLEIQKLITAGTLINPIDEGQFRTNDEVRVIDSVDGEIMHQPPSVKELNKLIDELCVFFNTENEDAFIHPIIKASIIHFLIGYIHPFADGNGRTARAFFYWYLLKKGYWLTEYLSISSIILKTRVQYAKAFLYTETDENDLTYFIQYKIKILQLAYTGLKGYLKRKQNEKSSSSIFLTVGGINERQAMILQELMDDADKILSVKEQELRYGVSNQTARHDLQGLEKFGLIKGSYINKKKQIFSRSVNFLTKVDELKRGVHTHR